jgi:hypothetical protein
MNKTGFVALLILVQGSAAFATAPHCSGLFSKASIAGSFSEDSVVTTLTQLAKLKLDIDTELSGNVTSQAVLNIKKQEFKTKFKELSDVLRAQSSSRDANELLKNKIRELQAGETKNREKEKETENKVREKLAEVVKAKSIPYTLTENIRGNSAAYMSHLNIFVHKNGKLVSHFDERMSINTKNTGGGWYVGDFTAGALMKDGLTYIAFNEKHFIKLDVAREELSPKTQLATKFTPPSAPNGIKKVSLTPSENLALLSGMTLDKAFFIIVDVKTGREVLSHLDLANPISDVVLLNENHIAVLRDTNLIEAIEISTGNIVMSQRVGLVNDGKVPRLLISKDGGQLLAANTHTTVVVRPTDLTPLRELEIADFFKHGKVNLEISENGTQAIAMDLENGLRVLDIATGKAAFDFEGIYGQDGKVPRGFAVSADGSTVWINHQPIPNSEFRFDVWVRGQQ